MTAADLLEKVLGPSEEQSQDALLSANGTLKRADALQRPNRTWHGAYNFSAFSGQAKALSKVSFAVFDTHCFCLISGQGAAQKCPALSMQRF